MKSTEDHVIKPFDCGDGDLNDFLFNDAKDYYLHRLSVTYLTVDALNNAVQFYSKNKFRPLRREALAQDAETFQLYFDLAQLD